MRPAATLSGISAPVRACALAMLAAFACCANAFAADDPLPDAIRHLAQSLETHFVDPATGQRYARMLRTNLAAGRYAHVGDTQAVAQRLTQDLQAVAADGHLRVDIDPGQRGAGGIGGPGGPGQPGRPGGGAGPRVGTPATAPASAATPPSTTASSTSHFAPVELPSVAETKWIADGVAYIRFNQFAGEPASVAAVQAFTRDYASAHAIIIDTRTLARGGGWAEMDALFPHLFDHETALVRMAMAKGDPADGPPPLGGPAMREVAGPPGLFVREHVAVPDPHGARLAEATVFFLISKRTRSAGEHFALALKRTHRATLIGEATAGANHFGGVESLGAGLAAFIPVGRTYDPDTGKDWEGTGVQPDIVVPPDQALDRALALAKG